MKKYKIEIDKENCISCNACETVCPNNFKVKYGEKSRALKDIVNDNEVAGCREAEETCPVDVIKVTEI